MKKFTIENWQEALVKVYEQAIIDPAYHHLCLNDPRAAVLQVEPELELPEYFQFEFVARRKDMFFSFLLPPSLPGVRTTDTRFDEIVQTLVCCTHPTFTSK